MFVGSIARTGHRMCSYGLPRRVAMAFVRCSDEKRVGCRKGRDLEPRGVCDEIRKKNSHFPTSNIGKPRLHPLLRT